MAPEYNMQAVAFAHILMGYEATVFGIVTQYFGDSSYTQSLLIVAFLLYTIAVILFVLTQFDTLIFDLAVAAIVISFMLVAAIFIVTSIALSSTHSQENPYAAVLYVSSALLGVAVVVFVTISMNADSHFRRTAAS